MFIDLKIGYDTVSRQHGKEGRSNNSTDHCQRKSLTMQYHASVPKNNMIHVCCDGIWLIPIAWKTEILT